MGGTTFAGLSSGNLIGLLDTAYVGDTWSTGTNVDVRSNNTVADGASANALRFATTGGLTVNLAGTATLASGGLLVTAGTGTAAASLTGGTLTSGVNEFILTQANNAATFTLNSVLADGAAAASLTKAGSGTLRLTGANTFTGGVTIAAGTLAIQSDAALGAVPAVAQTALTLAGGTLASSVNATLATNRNVALVADSAISVGAAANLTVNGAVSGQGGLTKTGNGTLTLAGASTAAGATRVAAGTLALANANALGASTVNLATGDLGTVSFGSSPPPPSAG